MCGIAGIVDRRQPVDHNLLHGMADAIFHRGPDDGGVVADGHVGLVNRRLAILDLSPAGRQPMATSDGQFVLTYNGELYNYPALKTQLQQQGVALRSTCDTEVVLEILARQGADAIPSLNGMFAFAFYDKTREEVLLARDRFGVKPLYYAELGDVVLFGSEIKAMLTHPSLKAEIDTAGLVEYFTFQNFLSSRTLFNRVKLLPPGCTLRIPVRSGPVRIDRYWDYSFSEPDSVTDRAAYEEELDRLFRQAVERQLLSDVDVGTYLSGGMDTGALTTIAAKLLPELRSFTVGFDISSVSGLEVAFDERPKAERIAYLAGTEHYEMVLKAGDMERSLPALMWHLEEPRVGQSYPNFFAAKLASRFGKVVLSGTGGDELFAGYPWRYYRAVVNDSFDQYVDKYFDYWQRLIPEAEAKVFFSPVSDGGSDIPNVRETFRSVFDQHASEMTRPEDFINHSLYFEAKTFLHGLLIVEDKLSMAHSLETRVPFLDNDLVDFAMRIPVRMKLGNLGKVVALNENEPGPKTAKYFARTNDGKLILRETLARYVPQDVTATTKQGFSGPDASWFRGESIDYVRRRLLSPSARVFDFLDRRTVEGLVNDHLEGRHNRRLLIWSLLCFEQWIEIFLEGNHPESGQRA